MIKDQDGYITSYFEGVVIQYWLKGFTRDEIAQVFNKSTGTVSNIWTCLETNLVIMKQML
jgi:hypothetical protein